jgi:hypothetical protein
VKRHVVSLGMFLLFALACLGAGQTFTGTITGHVLDPKRAPVPNATVFLKSIATDVERHTTTGSEGDYIFAVVLPGRYALRAEASGLAQRVVTVEVAVAASARADIALGIEGIKQSVLVMAEGGVSVQTDDAQLGQTVNQLQVAELPSVTRNPYDFVALSAGANPSRDSRGVGFAVNGQRSSSGNYILDGGENNDTFIAGPAQMVPLDAVQEYRLQTSNYTAEYGRGAGFIANVVTKSGTEQFHGSLYDFIRNSVFAANTFNNNANGLARPLFNRHQFGGTLGGPLLKRQLFFFASLEPIRVRSRGPNTFFVPTPELLAISSPGTQAILQMYPLPPNLSTTNVLTRTVCPFDAACDSQTGAGFVTLPAFAFTSRMGPQDAGAGAPQDTILFTGRADWTINSRMQFFARYAFQNKNQFPTVLQPYSSKLDQPASGRNQNAALNLLRIWSTHWVTESRVVYNRVIGDPENPSGGGNFPSTPKPPFPNFFFFNEPATLPFGSSSFGGPQNLYQFFHSATRMKGKHTLKFGGQYVHLRDNRTYGALETANAVFTNVQGFVNGILRRYDIALDPKGHVPGEQVNPPFGPPSFTRHFHYNEPSLFVQDMWKITPRLTLTPGLRWEYFGVLHSPGAERALDANFYLGSGDSLLQEIASGRFLRAVDAPGSLQGKLYSSEYSDFSPRLGLAYDFFGGGKTVFRCGIGKFYDRNFGNVVFNVMQDPPSYSVVTLRNIPVTRALLTDQYAAFPNGPITLRSNSGRMLSADLKTAYTVSWNATVEREVAGKFVAAASYLGSSGNRLYTIHNINRYGSGGLLNSSCVTTLFASDGVTALGPNYADRCPRLNVSSADITRRGNFGHSTYHGLQLKLDSRYVQAWGLQFGVNYTLSHSIDNNSSTFADDSLAANSGGFLDAFDQRRDKGPSDFDQRHRLAAYFIWNIPLGRNAKNWRGKYLIGGWELSGLLTFQADQPFGIFDSGVFDFGIGRPRLTGPAPSIVVHPVPDASNPNSFLYLPINPVYDPDSGLCLANAAPFACEISVNGPFHGNISRNTYRRPGTQFQNVAFMKNFSLRKEELKLQVRAEFYNLLNHPNMYVSPATNDVNSSTFDAAPNNPSPGVTAHFADNRQIVIALNFIF